MTVRLILWIAFAILGIASTWIVVHNQVGAEKRLVGNGIVALAVFVAWFVYSVNLEPVEKQYTAFFPSDERGLPRGSALGLACEPYFAHVVQPLGSTIERLRKEGPGDPEAGYWLHYVPAGSSVRPLNTFDTEMWMELLVFCIQHRIFTVSRPHLNEVRLSSEGVEKTEALSSLRAMEVDSMTLQDFLRRSPSRVWRSLNLDIGHSDMRYPRGMSISVSTDDETGNAIIAFDSKRSHGRIRIARGIQFVGSFVQFEITCTASFADKYKMNNGARAERRWFVELFDSLADDQ